MNKRYALCIGNNYPGTSAALRGCVNDAYDWQTLLGSQGYDVEVLIEATKAQTLDRLRTMVAGAGWADRVVFTYSGHGTWIPDRDGDEADQRDEALVMVDYMDGGLLVDDELQEIFGALRLGAAGLILPDSCHSGTVSRLWQAPTGLGRFLPPETFIEGLDAPMARALEGATASKPRPTASMISGCSDLEFSYDASFGGRPNGAFTRAAVDTFKPGISLGDWHAAIRGLLPSANYPQTPELTAASRYRSRIRAL